MEQFSRAIPVLLASLQDGNSDLARQSIIRGTYLFCHAMSEIKASQQAKIGKCLDELWPFMIKFKDAMVSVVLEVGPVGKRLLGMKFLETYLLLLSSEDNGFQRSTAEVPMTLKSEANKVLGFLLNMLESGKNLPGALTIALVNCLAAIARKRPLHYRTILSALLEFVPHAEAGKGCHAASIKYSLRTAIFGFLRSTSPSIVETRDELLKASRLLNAGDAAEQVIRQVDKSKKNNDRTSRDTRFSKDHHFHPMLPRDSFKKRPLFQDNYGLSKSRNVVPKRTHNGYNGHMNFSNQSSNLRQDFSSNGKQPTNASLLSSKLAPAEQMMAMIGALLAEGERGVESLEILIMNMHPDLLADIVISNMKHLPKSVLLENYTETQQVDISSDAQHKASVQTSIAPTQASTDVPLQTSIDPAQAATDVPFEDSVAPVTDSNRDPRKDLRRLDPRRSIVPVSDHLASAAPKEASTLVEEGSTKSPPFSMPITKESAMPVSSNLVSIDETFEGTSVSGRGLPISGVVNKDVEVESKSEAVIQDHLLIHPPEIDGDSVAQQMQDANEIDLADGPSLHEPDQHPVDAPCQHAPDETSDGFPLLPLFVEQTEEQQLVTGQLALERIIDTCNSTQQSCQSKMCMTLLARLVAQKDADQGVVQRLQKHILFNYNCQKAHELVLHILYHLHSMVVTISVDHSPSSLYEEFLLGVVEWLLCNLPASDKSFSKLLGEAPVLPDSVLKLLEALCHEDIYDSHGREIRDADRVTQGLGAVWSLILGRPPYRQACLFIALKCAVHLQDDIRLKAIRLVANKLYALDFVRGNICQFATSMLLSAVDQQEVQAESAEERSGEVNTQETSISGSQFSSLEYSGHHVSRGIASINSSGGALRQSQHLVSLYFALCMKDDSLLRLMFDVYGRSTKAMKQTFNRHIPAVVRSLGSFCSELLSIIADPPQGSEPLVLQVLQVLTEGETLSSDLIAIVKHLYQTKLKDATILIPVLSSLTKNEVLPIFSQLVNLPLEKFQLALAHILQGSAHTGPALTPVEVLVAIHDIDPDKDGIPLKKITDACSTCFEQRVVFTQQVLRNALSEMVEQPSLPMLFMRTVIQAIDAFPTLVDFIMEILSKLVTRQVWRMPKLWVGFLKCVSQTQPHSFNVLLQLPPMQLESALNKYPNLRTQLVSHARHPSMKSSISRPTLVALGLSSDGQSLEHRITSPLQPSDAASSVHGAAAS